MTRTPTQHAAIVEVCAPQPTIIHLDGLLQLPEVTRLTGLRRSAIYERMGAGSFPLARSLGDNVAAWQAGEVLDWIKALPRVLRRRAPVRTRRRA